MMVRNEAFNTWNGLETSNISILFSVEDYNANLTWAEQTIIDSFFDSLDWTYVGSTSSLVQDFVPFGNLMELFDYDNRWIYNGS